MQKRKVKICAMVFGMVFLVVGGLGSCALANEPKVPEDEVTIGLRPEGNCNTARDLLVTHQGYWVATGGGLAFYPEVVHSVEPPKNTHQHVGPTLYTTQDGLVSNNCFSVQADAWGGYWIEQDEGVSRFNPVTKKIQSFSSKNGLTTGEVRTLCFSNEKRVLWVFTTDGVNRYDLKTKTWTRCKGKKLVKGFVSPDGTRVFARRIIPSMCMCGQEFVLAHLDPQSGTWHSINETFHKRVEPKFGFLPGENLWLNNGLEPPLFYNMKTKKVHTVPERPNWERGTQGPNGFTVSYSDWFGQSIMAPDASGDVYCATGAGIWVYSPKTQEWTCYRHTDDPGCESPLLRVSEDKQSVYWIWSDLYHFSVKTKKWTKLGTLGEKDYFKPVDALLDESSQSLWANDENRLVRFDLKTGKTTGFSPQNLPRFGKPRFLKIGHYQQVLFGSTQGISAFSRKGDFKRNYLVSSFPMDNPVIDFAFTPDGKEVWCFQKSEYHRSNAFVFNRATKSWRPMTNAKHPLQLKSYLFRKTPKGTTAYGVFKGYPKGTPQLLQRDNQGPWKPFACSMPNYYTPDNLWLSPDQKELWVDADGSGVYRIMLNTPKKQPTQYVKSSFRASEDEATIVEIRDDYVQSLLFTPDNRYAIFSVGPHESAIVVVDRTTGKVQQYPIEYDARELVWQGNAIRGQTGRNVDYLFDMEKRTVKKIKEDLDAAEKARYVERQKQNPYQVQCVRSKGQTVLHLKDKKTKKLLHQYVIPSRDIYSIRFSPQNELWIGLKGRILCIDLTTKQMTTYPKE